VPRFQWPDLPEAAREAIQRRFGAVHDAVSAEPGLTPGVAAHLTTPGGTVFLKAIPLRSPALPHYLRELNATTALPAGVPAPSLLWSGRADGWLLLVFQHIPGARHADLTPGSADIPRVIAAVACMGEMLTPCPWPGAPDITEKIDGMRRHAEPELGTGPAAEAFRALDLDAVRGSTLLHADLHEGNLLINSRGVHVIDWSLASQGAAWVDLALLAPRLVAAGHTPEQTETIMTQAPVWRTAPAEAVTGLAAVSYAFSSAMASRGPEDLRQRRRRTADAAAAWLTHRLRGGRR